MEAINWAQVMLALGVRFIGVFVILFPTVITGMCKLADHPCNILTKPMLILLGIAALIVSAYVAYLARAD